jgi:hypothetical protein
MCNHYLCLHFKLKQCGYRVTRISEIKKIKGRWIRSI